MAGNPRKKNTQWEHKLNNELHGLGQVRSYRQLTYPSRFRKLKQGIPPSSDVLVTFLVGIIRSNPSRATPTWLVMSSVDIAARLKQRDEARRAALEQQRLEKAKTTVHEETAVFFLEEFAKRRKTVEGRHHSLSLSLSPPLSLLPSLSLFRSLPPSLPPSLSLSPSLPPPPPSLSLSSLLFFQSY